MSAVVFSLQFLTVTCACGPKVCDGLIPKGGIHSSGGFGVAAVRVVEVELPNKAVALVRAADLDEGGQVAEKVGWKETFDLGEVSGTREGITRAIRSGLEKVAPSKTTVELGIQLAVKNGKLTGLIVEGKADASLKVTLEWAKESSADGPAA